MDWPPDVSFLTINGYIVCISLYYLFWGDDTPIGLDSGYGDIVELCKHISRFLLIYQDTEDASLFRHRIYLELLLNIRQNKPLNLR